MAKGSYALPPPFDELVAAHLRHMERRNLRPSTVLQRYYMLRRLQEQYGKPPHELTFEEMEAWIDRGTIAVEGRATEISHLRQYWKWLVIEGHVPVDLTLRLVRPRVPPRMPRPMPDDQLADAIKHAPDRVRVALKLAAYAGLRACEIAGLRGEHALLDQEPPVLIVVEGKGGRPSSVPISEELRNELRRWPRRGPVYPRLDGRPGHAAPHNVSQTVNVYLQSRRIYNHTLHTVRHWFGTNAYRATGRDLRATQELMRHRTVVSTQLYTYVDPGELATAVNTLRPE